MRRNKTSTTPLFADQKTHPQWSREGRILPVFEPRKPLMRAIIYARFSPRRNADECESCEQQVETCSAYCAEHGYEVAGIYYDRGRSGDDEDRPGLWAAIEALPRGGVLVAHKPDRLARSVYLSEYIRRAVSKRNGSVETVTGSNGDSAEDVFVRQILQAFAEYEKKVIAARTKAAMRRHQSNGRSMSSNAPYGYSISGKRLLEKPSEQQTLTLIQQLAADGDGPSTIATKLNNDRVPSRGKQWNHKTVARIIGRDQET